jgi:hypothetical protein
MSLHGAGVKLNLAVRCALGAVMETLQTHYMMTRWHRVPFTHWVSEHSSLLGEIPKVTATSAMVPEDQEQLDETHDGDCGDEDEDEGGVCGWSSSDDDDDNEAVLRGEGDDGRGGGRNTGYGSRFTRNDKHCRPLCPIASENKKLAEVNNMYLRWKESFFALIFILLLHFIII